MEKIFHSLHGFGRADNLCAASKRGKPRIEGRADLHGGGESEVFAAVGYHHQIAPELVYYGVGQFVAEAHFDTVSLAAEHLKDFRLLACQALVAEQVFSFAFFLERSGNPLHPIHAVIAELLSIVGIEIEIAAVPLEGEGADPDYLAAVGVVLFAVRAQMEIQKSYLAVCADSLMDAVSLLYHAVILAADAVIDIGAAV